MHKSSNNFHIGFIIAFVLILIITFVLFCISYNVEPFIRYIFMLAPMFIVIYFERKFSETEIITAEAIFREYPPFEPTVGFATISLYLKTLPYKSALYLLYIFITIFAQLPEFSIEQRIDSEFFRQAFHFLSEYLAINKYSILILIAVDRFISQKHKDREKYSFETGIIKDITIESLKENPWQKNKTVKEQHLSSEEMNHMLCESNKSIKCPCTYSCGKHGKCCECVAYHQRSGEFPACFFSEKAEKSYDRSFEAIIEDRK